MGGLQELHPSLNNNTRIQSWITKQRVLSNPLGQSYDAVVFQYLMDKHHQKDQEINVVGESDWGFLIADANVKENSTLKRTPALENEKVKDILTYVVPRVACSLYKSARVWRSAPPLDVVWKLRLSGWSQAWSPFIRRRKLYALWHTLWTLSSPSQAQGCSQNSETGLSSARTTVYPPNRQPLGGQLMAGKMPLKRAQTPAPPRGEKRRRADIPETRSDESSSDDEIAAAQSSPAARRQRIDTATPATTVVNDDNASESLSASVSESESESAPSLVIETGVSKSLAKLLRDAIWWFQILPFILRRAFKMPRNYNNDLSRLLQRFGLTRRPSLASINSLSVGQAMLLRTLLLTLMNHTRHSHVYRISVFLMTLRQVAKAT